MRKLRKVDSDIVFSFLDIGHSVSESLTFSRFQEYRVLESIAECYRVLQGVTECYRVLQSVTECYRVLQSVTEYYIAGWHKVREPGNRVPR